VTRHSALGRFLIRFALAPVRGVLEGILSLPSIPVTNLPIRLGCDGRWRSQAFGLDPKLWTRAFGGRFAIRAATMVAQRNSHCPRHCVPRPARMAARPRL